MKFLPHFGSMLLLCASVLGIQTLQAGQIGLADWCVNLNGSVDAFDVADNPSNACNGGQNATLAAVDTAGFDQTLEDGANSNGLGTITVTLGPGPNQYVSFYADYDVDFNAFGSVDDLGSTGGALPVNYSYELDDPNRSNIFSDFAANGLANTNNVAIPGTSPQCCNVALALSLSAIDVLAGNSATVTFVVSSITPLNSFYLIQTNQDTNETIYLTGNVGSTPEPSTFFLALIALAISLVAACWESLRAIYFRE